jgi:hypothetical protein
LNQLERKSRWYIYDIITSDHLIARRSTDYAIRYLAVCARHIRKFIQDNALNMLCGELTWAFEQVAGQVCIDLDVPFIRPVDVRIPFERTAFYTSRLETDIVELRQPNEDDLKAAREFLHAYRNRPRKPAYMNVKFTTFQLRTERIRLLTRHVIDLAGDPYDETSRRPPGLVVDHSKQALRTYFRSKFARFEMPDMESKRPFVFLALHLQPEASIDVIAAPFCNQIENAQAMARTLPVTHDLYVKEHLFALGKRPPGAYDELLKIPGVRLIDPRADTFALMQKAALIVTGSGTVAYEASLLRRPAVTMARTVFSPIVVSDHFNPYSDSLADILEQVANGHPRTDDEIIQYLAWLQAQTFEGAVGDAFWQPHTLEPAYVDKVAQGFFQLFRKFEGALG